MMIRRFAAACLFMSMALPAWAGGLPPARDLQRDGRVGGSTGRPILVFFMADSCSYCEEVRRLYLEPMYADPAYQHRLIFRTVNINDPGVMKDFRGRSTNQGRFADSQGVSFTPTIRFYDAHGSELVPQLRGYSSPDFYLAYLEDAVETSISRLHRRHTVIGAATPVTD